ncbi:C1 family peptidase (plasmid) [Streptomyces sp. BI20]|uniref:C1 family peptidase n=1 Tax=Streptomyces sp. BI20 TaxID=3403460 RepID=UPI003C75554F
MSRRSFRPSPRALAGAVLAPALAAVLCLTAAGGAVALEPAPVAGEAAPAPDGLLDAVDWRLGLAVTPAHDSGQCDEIASEAYATAAALEGAWVTRGHHLLTAFTPLITDAAGADVYPSVCAEPRPPLGAAFPAGAFKEWRAVSSGDEEALRAAVARGPVLARIDASAASFALYSGGVYDEPLCSSAPSEESHHVTVVGYGTTLAGEEYWTVKNDYGRNWGESGFVRMSRNQGNQCGIATDAREPILNPAPYTAPAQNPWPVFTRP